MQKDYSLVIKSLSITTILASKLQLIMMVFMGVVGGCDYN